MTARMIAAVNSSECRDEFLSVHLGVSDLKKIIEMCNLGLEKLEKDKHYLK